MKKFEDNGFTSIITNDKLKIEIPIANLVNAFNYNPNNYDCKIKRGKRKEFAEFLAKHIFDESDQETGANYIQEAFDKVFEMAMEDFDNDFIKFEDEDYDE